LKEKSVQE